MSLFPKKVECSFNRFIAQFEKYLYNSNILLSDWAFILTGCREHLWVSDSSVDQCLAEDLCCFMTSPSRSGYRWRRSSCRCPAWSSVSGFEVKRVCVWDRLQVWLCCFAVRCGSGADQTHPERGHAAGGHHHGEVQTGACVFVCFIWLFNNLIIYLLTNSSIRLNAT